MRAVATLVALTLTASALAIAGGQAAHAALPHTQRTVVRPVHANGTPVAGYRVVRESIDDFTCESVSPVAVDPNIDFCGFSATYTVACWKSTNHTALCLRDPRTKTLARIRYTGTFAPTRAPRLPSPQALGLFDGGYCTVRDGGAWGYVQGHPNWIGTYSCRQTSVYGPQRDGIDRSVNPWRVHTVAFGAHSQTITDRRVRTAYYVGTA